MTALHTLLWIAAGGLALLALGGEAVIRGGVMLKRSLGVSPVIIGLFVLSLGTASPVLAVAVQGAASGLPDLAIGTVIGATLVNLLLILGLGALIRPMPSAPKVVLRDGGAMLLAAAALVLLALHGSIGRREGVFLVAGFVVYAIVAVVSDWRRSSEHSVACAEAERRALGEPSFIGGLFAIAIGAICLLVGAHFTARGAFGVSALTHLPLSTLSLTAIALGASLPVLGVTAIAALRGHTHIAIGHLIIASVFNVFGALGIAALVRPLTVSPVFAQADVFAVLAAGVLLLPLLSANWRLSRLKGATLVLAYIAYVGVLAWRQGLIPHALLGLA